MSMTVNDAQGPSQMKHSEVRIIIEGDDITINENITTNFNVLGYITSVKDRIFKHVPIKVVLSIIDGKNSYQIFMGTL